jgi:hypothetical protein
MATPQAADQLGGQFLIPEQSPAEPQGLRGLQASTGQSARLSKWSVRKSECRTQDKNSETEKGEKQNGKPKTLSQT